MAQIVKLKRTAVSGKIPTTSNLQLGELAMNTYDGRIFFEKDSGTPTVNEILTTNTENYITGSLTLNGNITATNITLSGDLVVEGTTTTIDSTTVNIGDNILELNYGGTSTTSGLLVKDATGGSTTSGSLLWDATNDYWKAGTLGSESEVITTSNIVSNLPTGTVSGSSQLNNTTINGLTINTGSFGSGSGSPTFSEFRYNNSNVMSFNQMYLGNQNGTYFTNGEYQKVVTIIPSGDSQNYQIVGRITAQNAGETHTVYFNAALRSNTLPDLNWTITYHEEYNGNRYINPLLWTKETTTAGFIFAFETLGTIYGNVTVDMDVIPRTSLLLDNVTVNTNQSSEQSSVDSGYTSNDFSKTYTVNGSNVLFSNGILSGSSQVVSSLSNQSINLGTGAVTASYFVGDGSQLTNVSATISENATVTGSFSNASSFTINHNFNSKNVLVSVYDNNDSQIIPQEITLSDNDNVDITLSAAQSGFVVVAKGGHIVSGSASDASNLNGQPATYYLDYTNFNNIPSGIISSSAQIDNLFDIDGLVSSSAQVTSLLPSGTVSGSSQITDLTTHKETVSGASSYAVTHNLNESYPIVQAWNTSTSQQEIPQSITTNSANQVTVVFSTTFAGVIIVKK